MSLRCPSEELRVRMKLRIRTAAELARMFWKPSRYGSPIVDGLQLVPEEMKTIAQALAEYAKQQSSTGGVSEEKT